MPPEPPEPPNPPDPPKNEMDTLDRCSGKPCACRWRSRRASADVSRRSVWSSSRNGACAPADAAQERRTERWRRREERRLIFKWVK